MIQVLRVLPGRNALGVYSDPDASLAVEKMRCIIVCRRSFSRHGQAGGGSRTVPGGPL